MCSVFLGFLTLNPERQSISPAAHGSSTRTSFCHRVTSCQPGAWLRWSDSPSSGTSSETSPDSESAWRRPLFQLHSRSPASPLSSSLATPWQAVGKTWRTMSLWTCWGWWWIRVCVSSFGKLWPVSLPSSCPRRTCWYLFRWSNHRPGRMVQLSLVRNICIDALCSLKWWAVRAGGEVPRPWGMTCVAMGFWLRLVLVNYPSTSVCGKEEVGSTREAVTDAQSAYRWSIYLHRFSLTPRLLCCFRYEWTTSSGRMFWGAFLLQ